LVRRIGRFAVFPGLFIREINRAAQSGLRLSARLTKLARDVREQGGARDNALRFADRRANHLLIAEVLEDGHQIGEAFVEGWNVRRSGKRKMCAQPVQQRMCHLVRHSIV
jgi:hypothetical protein